MKLIVALLVFGIIVIFHEFGHFIVAKKNGIVVEEFAVGMGPKLFVVSRSEKEYIEASAHWRCLHDAWRRYSRRSDSRVV